MKENKKQKQKKGGGSNNEQNSDERLKDAADWQLLARKARALRCIGLMDSLHFTMHDVTFKKIRSRD